MNHDDESTGVVEIETVKLIPKPSHCLAGIVGSRAKARRGNKF